MRRGYTNVCPENHAVHLTTQQRIYYKSIAKEKQEKNDNKYSHFWLRNPDLRQEQGLIGRSFRIPKVWNAPWQLFQMKQ